MSPRRQRSRLGALGVTALLCAAAAAPDSPVADAAMKGDAERVRTLLQEGADVNAAHGDGMTALHWAAQKGDVAIASMLINAGANLDAVTRNGGYSALHRAAMTGSSSVVEMLLKAGAEPDVKTATGSAALHFAAGSGSVATIAALLDAGANVNLAETAFGGTPLMWAAAYDRVDALRLLLQRGGDPALTSRVEDVVEWERQALMAEDRRNARVDALRALERGEEVGTRILRTIEQVQKVVVTDELAYAELVGRRGGLTPLLFATREGHLDGVLALLDAGVDINQPSAGDHTSPLLMATINGQWDLAMRLIERGADPNVASDAGATPLYAAINLQWHSQSLYPQPNAFRQQETGYLDLMEALLKAGADPNVRLTRTLWYSVFNFDRLGVDFAGSTAFWRAAYATDVDAMRLLVKYGADPSIATVKPPEPEGGEKAEDRSVAKPKLDPSGLPPVPAGGPALYPIHAASGAGYGIASAAGFHRPRPQGWLPSMKYLVEELGVDVNLRDLNGYTALHNAAARGDNELILYLVGKGADVTLVSRKGQTTADMANGPGGRLLPFLETVKLLERLGSKNNHDCRSC